MTLAFYGNAQSSFFEKQKGVKSIKHTMRSGSVESPQFSYRRQQFFDEEGNLIRVHRGPKSVDNYLHRNDTIIRVSTDADCTMAWFYYSKTIGNITYSKNGNYFGKGYWGSSCGNIPSDFDFPIDGTIIYNDSFSNVIRTHDLVDDFYNSISISEYKDDSSIFLVYNYELTKDSSQYELSWINMDKKIQDEFIHILVFRIEEEGERNIILNYQVVEDKQGSLQEGLFKERLYQPKDKIDPIYKYDFDERGNWIKRTLNHHDPKRMEESYREYEYY